MRVTVTTDSGQVDLRVPGGYQPDVLHDLCNRALSLLAGVVCTLEHQHDEDEETEGAA